jgi:1,4-alpha-glucan branching enzyme
MGSKFFSLVLHSHIPYVLAHGNWPHGMDWLYEAAAESYLPLLDVFCRLMDEGLAPNVNISFTPVLMEQLKSRSFASGFKKYLQMKIDIACQDRAYFEKTGNKTLLALTFYWEAWYQKLLEDFTATWQEDILGGFRKLRDQDQIEVLTSAATHAYFPLLSRDDSIRWQVRQGKSVYRQHFGRDPQGFWLPECAYRPRYAWKRPFGTSPAVPRLGVDEILGEEGLGYFFVDTHLLSGGEVKGVYLDRFPALKLLWEKFRKECEAGKQAARSPYLPYLADPSRIPFFARDDRSGSQVWSGKTGYPGDGWYLEFHKKHFPGGIRYWRITSSGADLGDKQPYDPGKTRERLDENAGHFVDSVAASLHGQDEGVVAALYDTELFGHWWFEGPEWLYAVIKKFYEREVKPRRAGDCLEALRPHVLISLPEGSWGTGGFHWIWLNDDTAWIWDKIYRIEEEATKLVPSLVRQKPGLYRQFMREKFLLESSDWPFLISTWTARDYAENRAAEHFQRARTLVDWLKRDAPLNPDEQKQLATWEEEDKVFTAIVTPDGDFI